MEGREVRRTMTLSEHMSAIDGSSQLRDLLKVREEEDGVRQSRRSLTLASVLADEKREAGAAGATSSSSTNRTLMDIIREEQMMTAQTLPRATSGREMFVSEYSTAATAQPEEASATRAAAGGGVGAGDDTSGRGDGSAGAGETEQQPIRVSLMALLEQTDRYGGVMAAAQEGEEAEEGEAEGMFFVCCVCMVRHKGAAFIPCGHTFCRLCSREVWVSRGNCPLCNGYILEILDIF